jgi:hypothetical protein
MNYLKLASVAQQTGRSAVDLQKFFAQSQKELVVQQKEELKQEEKLIATRKDVFRSLLDQVEEAKNAQSKNSPLGTLLGALGLGGLASGLKSIKAPKPSVPKLPTGVKIPKPNLGGIKSPRVPKVGLGRAIPGLNIALTGVDFIQRQQEGQTNLQAGAGAVGGLAGALAGGKAGAALGAGIGALFGGVGAAPGALIGGLLGSVAGGFAGSGLADTLTGANSTDERVAQLRREKLNLGPSKFSSALDQFDVAINNLTKLAASLGVTETKLKKLDGSRALTGPGEQPRDERSLEEIINEPYTADQIEGAVIPDPEIFSKPSTPMPDASRPGALSDPSNPDSPRIGEQVGAAPMPQTGSTLLAVSETFTKETEMSAGQDSVLMINNQPNTVVAMSPQMQQPMGGGGSTPPSSYDNATKYAQMISSLTR